MIGHLTLQCGLMQRLVIVTHPEPLPVEAQITDPESDHEDHVIMAYFVNGKLIARGTVLQEAAEAIQMLLRQPMPVALAATEDEDGNIGGQVCLLLPSDLAGTLNYEMEEPEEPWKSSIPAPPPEVDSSYVQGEEVPEPEDESRERIALLPLGNVLRPAKYRNHPDNIAGDAKEMLEVLLAGKARNAVQQAIDDLLDSI